MKYSEFLKPQTKQLHEKLAYGKDDTVTLETSDINDPDIQRILQLYADTNGVNLADAQVILISEVTKMVNYLSKSPEINENAIANAPAAMAFDMMEKIKLEEINWKTLAIDEDELLDGDVFFDLTEYIIRENREFFPLRNPHENKSIKPYFYIAPDDHFRMNDPSLVQYSQGDFTAFCTPTAQIVFCRAFSERMCLYSLLRNKPPKSKKYVSNGGDIPDHYEYIEFIIMHELLHYTAGDHFYTKPMVEKIMREHPGVDMGKAHKILNYVGDYINNWTLMKSGYSQLPIGLFSKDVNYDVQGTYEEIIEAVIDSFAQMEERDFDDMSSVLDGMMDDHQDSGGQAPSQGGSGGAPSSKPKTGSFKVGDIVTINKSGKKAKITAITSTDAEGKQTIEVDEILEESIMLTSDDVTAWEEGDEDGSGGGSGGSGGEPGEGEGEDGDGDGDGDGAGSGAGGGGGGPGSGESSEDGDLTDEIDQAMKDAQNKMDKKEDGSKDGSTADILNGEGAAGNQVTSASDAARKAVGDGGSSVQKAGGYKPVNWKKVLKKMVPAPTQEMEDCYNKMSRDSISSAVGAVSTGSARLKPGECPDDPDKKGLCIIIDNSGSVSDVLEGFNKEILRLLINKKTKKMLENFYVIKFSSDFVVFKVNVEKGTFQEVQNPRQLFKKDGQKIDPNPKLKGPELKTQTKLFEKTFAYSTDYTNEMHFVINALWKANFNMILFTDDDLTSGQENTKNVTKFYALGMKRKGSVAVFLTDQSSYVNMGKKFGSPRWVTVIA